MTNRQISLRSFAVRYNTSHETIRKIKSEGIDLSDEQAVLARLAESPNHKPAVSLPLTIPASSSETGLRAAIERLQAAEVAAHADYLNALQNAPGDAGRALKAWQTILEQLRKVEAENPTIERENDASVSKDELAKVLGELFKNLRMDLDALPRKVSLAAGEKREAVEKAAEEEKDRIVLGLLSCRYISD